MIAALRRSLSLAATFASLAAAPLAQLSPQEIVSFDPIGVGSGGFTGTFIDGGAQFGASITLLGDLDGNGVRDLAVGAPEERIEGQFSDPKHGALWLLYMNADGTVASNVRIIPGENGYVGQPPSDGRWGRDVAVIGDLDGNGHDDLAVGAPGDSAQLDRGNLDILFMGAGGVVIGEQRLNWGENGMPGDGSKRWLGFQVAPLGDLDGDGVPDIVASAPRDSDEVPFGGSLWVLMLNADGTVKRHQKISTLTGGLVTPVRFRWLGRGLDAIGDFDGDGLTDLAVGATDTDGVDAVWLLFLEDDGTVKSHLRISGESGGFAGPHPLTTDSVRCIGDYDGDGIIDLATGGQPAGGGTASVWLLSLDTDGTVKAQNRLSIDDGGLNGTLGLDDPYGPDFGESVVRIDDVDGDGMDDFAIGRVSVTSVGGLGIASLGDRTTWTELGGGVAGTFAVPTMKGKGQLGADDPELTVEMFLIWPGSTAFFVLGLSAVSAPFKGGVLVPSPDVVVPFPTGPLFQTPVTLTFGLPDALPVGAFFAFQLWVLDPGGPFGFAASNGLTATVP